MFDKKLRKYCGDVTVGDIIEILSKYPKDMRVNFCGVSEGYLHFDTENNVMSFDHDNLEWEYGEASKDNEKMHYRKKCTFCSKVWEIPMTYDQYRRLDESLSGGDLLGEAVPDLEPKWREMFLSGMCPDCWEKMAAACNEEDGDLEE